MPHGYLERDGVKVTGSYAGYEVSYRYFRPDESTPGSKTLSADGTDKTSRYNLLADLPTVDMRETALLRPVCRICSEVCY